MYRIIVIVIGCLLILVLAVAAQDQLPWPVYPDSTRHIISAVYGCWVINPGYPPFMHSGIDIDVVSGTPVYAMTGGWVKTITSRGEGYSTWRVVIGDSSGTDTCDAWMYAHIRELSITVWETYYVEAGTYIGDVVDWPGTPGVIEHLHLSKIRYAGTTQQWADGQNDWVFIANPLDFMMADIDDDAPILQNAHGDDLLAFCRNESDVYFDPGEPISGDVDIICRAYDYYNTPVWKNVPYQIEYKIDGAVSVPWTMAASFTGVLGTYDQMPEYTYIVYQDDATCNTHFDMSQDYFFNLTNSDGDTLVEPSDKALCWETMNFPNGDYWVHVRARDKYGNIAQDSMMVTVGNYFTVSGTVTLAGGNPKLDGTIVSCGEMGVVDTTDVVGAFMLSGLDCGQPMITISRNVYETLDTVMISVHDTTLNVMLGFGDYSCGDANGDGGVRAC